MRTILSTAALLAAAFVAPALAHADTFTVTPVAGGTPPTLTLSFTLPHTPTAISTVPAGTFSVAVPVTRNGVVDATDIITFYTFANGGGFSDNDSSFLPFGPQLFTGLTTATPSPTFIYGTFNLSNESQGGATDYILTIAPNAVSATPEPSSLVLLGSGVLGLAGVARRRLQK